MGRVCVCVCSEDLCEAYSQQTFMQKVQPGVRSQIEYHWGKRSDNKHWQVTDSRRTAARTGWSRQGRLSWEKKTFMVDVIMVD